MKRFPSHKSLKKEILIDDFIVILLIFVIVITSIITIYVSIFFDEITTKNQILTNSITYQINEHTHRHIDTINNFAVFFETFLVDNNISPKILLSNLNKSEDMFLQIQIIDNSGIVLYSSDAESKDIGLDYSKQPYFTSLHAPREYCFSNSFLSEKFDKIITTYSMRTADFYYMVSLDLTHFNDHLESLGQNDDIIYLILDNSDTIISSSDDYLVDTRTKYNFLERDQSLLKKHELIILNDVSYMINESTCDILDWRVIILNNNKTLLNPIKQVIISSIAIAVLLLFFYTINKQKRIQRILKSINELKYNFKVIAQGDYDIQAHTETYSEFSDLSIHFAKSVEEIETREEEILTLNDNLELLVEKRTEEVNLKNEELNALLSELQSTQSMLIQSEKFASFSRLIAGIAHEINTPVGIGVTSSSYLNICIKNMNTAYQANNLSKIQFEEAIIEIEDLSDIILKNLVRAGDLITSFKKASGDNFYDNLTYYNLYELTSNLVKSIKLKYKDKAFHIDLDLPKKLEIRSYPSAMSQILTNLINNSITHGFKNRNTGLITIKVIEKDESIILEYKDDGHGVATEMYEKIFDPFFTTNRTDGGTGLGLSIIKNLVHNKLSGNIEIDSEVEAYTLFTITLPKMIKEPLENK